MVNNLISIRRLLLLLSTIKVKLYRYYNTKIPCIGLAPSVSAMFVNRRLFVVSKRPERQTNTNPAVKEPTNKVLTSQFLGRTWISRISFDEMWTNTIHLGFQSPKQQPDHLSSEEYHWLLIDSFASSCNRNVHCIV